MRVQRAVCGCRILYDQLIRLLYAVRCTDFWGHKTSASASGKNPVSRQLVVAPQISCTCVFIIWIRVFMFYM